MSELYPLIAFLVYIAGVVFVTWLMVRDEDELPNEVTVEERTDDGNSGN